MQKNNFNMKIDYREHSNGELDYYVPQVIPQFIIKLPDNEWITYIKTTKFSINEDDYDGEYKHLFRVKSLNELGNDNYESTQKFINEIFENYKDEQELVNKLIELISFFKEEKIRIDKKQLIGDLGEALFILKCIDMNLGKEALSSLRMNENDNYDFSLPNNKALEIKTTTKKTKQIKIDINQIKAHVIVVDLILKSDGININQVYDKILSFNFNIPVLLQEKINKYKNFIDKKLIRETCIEKYDDIEFGIFKSNDFPNIKIEQLNRCKTILFIMDSTNSKIDNEQFEQEIRDMFLLN